MLISKVSRWPAILVMVLGLAACQGAPEPPVAIGGTPQPTAQHLAPDANTGQVTFAFDPFTGAPGNIADELSKNIGTRAGSEGLVLVRRIGAPATYRVKGYLSATGSPSATTVFYVFDIVDGSGQRLKRISGTETIGGTTGDPWQAVDSTTLGTIANRTVVEMRAWLNRR